MNSKQKKALKAKFSDGLGSSGMMVSTLSEWYDAKHRPPSADEVAFVNSIPDVFFDGVPRQKRIRRNFANRQTLLVKNYDSVFFHFADHLTQPPIIRWQTTKGWVNSQLPIADKCVSLNYRMQVRRWVKQITIWDDRITIELKSGVNIDVDA